LYAITGAAVWPAVALGLVLALACVLLTFRLARAFVAPVPAGLAAALVAAAALGSANNSYVLPHSTSGPLATALLLGAALLLVGWMRRGERDAGRLMGAGALLGLVALTRLEVALPTYAALVLWMAVRAWGAGAGPGRRAVVHHAALLLVPAVALPFVGYGAFLTSVSPHALLFDNLYPRDFVAAGGDVVLKAHAPMTATSFATLIAKTAVYAAGVAALVVVGVVIERGGRLRRPALVAVAVAVVALLAVLLAKPDTLRFYLKWAYAWVPAGAALATVVLAVRVGRGRGSTSALGPALLLSLLLAGLTASTYAEFRPFPNADFPSATAYLLPFVAVFLAWLHVAVVPRGGAGAAVGALWLGLLVVASAGLAVHDARRETVTVRGPQGALTARPAEAPALNAALATIARETRTGDPILLAPQMSALYVMADRRNPLPELSLLPGALPTTTDEDRAIARMDHVRLAITDRTPLALYDQGAFGTSYDQRIAAWIRREFRHAATLRGAGQDDLSLDVWIRRSS
jgi:hypothetical protein